MIKELLTPALGLVWTTLVKFCCTTGHFYGGNMAKRRESIGGTVESERRDRWEDCLWTWREGCKCKVNCSGGCKVGSSKGKKTKWPPILSV